MASARPEIRGSVSDLHAAAAAAGRGLDQDREAHVLGDLQRLGFGRHFAVRARHHRNAELLRRLLGRDLVAHDANVLGRRPDERDRVLLEDLGEAGILGQEAVARMHRVGAGDLASAQEGAEC